jgi:hypothetical protein
MAKKAKTKKKIPGRTTVDGRDTRLGKKILSGKWHLVSPHGLEFNATHLATMNIDGTRIVTFKVKGLK